MVIAPSEEKKTETVSSYPYAGVFIKQNRNPIATSRTFIGDNGKKDVRDIPLQLPVGDSMPFVNDFVYYTVKDSTGKIVIKKVKILGYDDSANAYFCELQQEVIYNSSNVGKIRSNPNYHSNIIKEFKPKV